MSKNMKHLQISHQSRYIATKLLVKLNDDIILNSDHQKLWGNLEVKKEKGKKNKNNKNVSQLEITG